MKSIWLALSAVIGLSGAAWGQNSPNLADMTKGIIESPTARLLRSSVPQERKVTAQRYAKPGLVNWCAGWQSALDAARTSGKPVLLVQLLGNLDQEFC